MSSSSDRISSNPFMHYKDFQSVFELGVQLCPEIAKNEKGLITQASRLVNEYQPTPDFFDVKDNALGLVFASALQHTASQSSFDFMPYSGTKSKSNERMSREKSVANNFSWLVFGDYSLSKPHQEVRKVTTLTPDKRLNLFRKYQNIQYSREIAEWMNASEELRDIRSALGMSDDEANDFEPIVLSIGTDFHCKDFINTDSVTINVWKKNARQFMQEQGSADDDVVPYAWVSTINRKNYLCLPEPVYLACFDPSKVGILEEGDNLEELQALIAHEYVHCQTDLGIMDPNNENKGGRLGSLLTEYQAEVFSGFKIVDEYADIYNFVKNFERTAGINLGEIIRRHPRGGGANKPMFYFEIVNLIGLVPTAMLLSEKTADELNFQSTKADQLLSECYSKYNLCNEMIVRNGWEGMVNYFKRLNVKFDENLQDYWHDRLLKLEKT